MNEENFITDSNTETNNKTNSVSSPIKASKLVSKVNSLIKGNRSNFLTNPKTKSFSTEKGRTLDYKNVIDELTKL